MEITVALLKLLRHTVEDVAEPLLLKHKLLLLENEILKKQNQTLRELLATTKKGNSEDDYDDTVSDLGNDNDADTASEQFGAQAEGGATAAPDSEITELASLVDEGSQPCLPGFRVRRDGVVEEIWAGYRRWSREWR